MQKETKSEQQIAGLVVKNWSQSLLPQLGIDFMESGLRSKRDVRCRLGVASENPPGPLSLGRHFHSGSRYLYLLASPVTVGYKTTFSKLGILGRSEKLASASLCERRGRHVTLSSSLPCRHPTAFRFKKIFAHPPAQFEFRENR